MCLVIWLSKNKKNFVGSHYIVCLVIWILGRKVVCRVILNQILFLSLKQREKKEKKKNKRKKIKKMTTERVGNEKLLESYLLV